MAATALLCSSPAVAAPGDVYVADRGADAVWKFGPTGGEATPLAQGVPPFAGSPYGMTLGPDGFLYVADEFGFVYRVDRRTGAVQEVADVGTVNPSSNPIDVAFDARGRLLVVDYDSDDIYVVNRDTGALTPFFESDSNGFNALAIRRDGTIFISDENDNTVYRLSGGVLTPIIEGDPDLSGPDGILLSPDGRFLYVGSFDLPRFFRYNVNTGQVQKFELDGPPYSLTLLPSDQLIFSDADNDELRTVSRLGGPTTEFSTDPELQTPRDIVVEPKLCAGRIPTVVGTNAREVIVGSRFADVISTLGGNDVVRGLGGNDIVCGGAGNDRLLGGKGRDRIFGQAGRDRILGQAGSDRLLGGAGPDLLNGGRGKDRILGGRGRDRLLGGPGRDRLLGGPGRDRLLGGPGRDRLRGGPGRDRLRGGAGRDIQRQ